MKNGLYGYQVFVLLIIITNRVAAVEFDMRGQLSTQLTRRYYDDEWLVNAGIQYIPQLRLSRTISSVNIFDLDLSYHSFIHTDQEVSRDNLKLYEAKPHTLCKQRQSRRVLKYRKIDKILLNPGRYFLGQNPVLI